MKNPLIKPILEIIEEHAHGISEYQLLQQLEKFSENNIPIFSSLALNTPSNTLTPEAKRNQANLMLFRKHFLIMNALYQLQARLWQEDKVKLCISPLNIMIQTELEAELLSNTNNANSTELNISADAKLAAYYLDWSEYDNTQAEDVQLLLRGFYDKFNNSDDTEEALAILGVNANCSKADIKKAYRKHVHTAHPDKGGDTKTFVKLRRAYEHLVSQTPY